MDTLTHHYGSSSEDEADDDSKDKPEAKKAKVTIEENLHLKPSTSSQFSSVKTLAVVSAPFVQPNETMDTRRHLDPASKEVTYNPKYEDLFAPVVGPMDPNKDEEDYAPKNSLTGFIEAAHVNNFQFDLQRKTFHSYGYAMDPSTDVEGEGTRVIGDTATAGTSAAGEMKSVFEVTEKRPKDNRKKERNDDPSDIEGYLGPWAKYIDEETVSRPGEADKEYLEEYLSKMKRRAKKTVEEEKVEEKSTLHIKDAYDYQGRSYLHIPQDVGVNLKSDAPPEKCFIPKRQIHEWKGHTKGIAVIKWFPKSAHLIMSGALDSKVKLWEVYGNRRCVRTFNGHKLAVKDVDFNNGGDKFLSTSYDRYVKMWDTETGQCIGRYTNNKVGFCVKYHPDDDKQHMFVVGTGDKKVVQWDTRSNEIVQEYDRHLSAVNTITFVDENRRFVTTSDDKSMRIWEWEIPVDMKYIADAGMHSMPAACKSPNEKWLALQSLDNKICIYTIGEKFREQKKKVFKGHMVAGYACGLSFSPEMSYLASGDGDGKCCIWDWKTTRLVAKWKAHDRVCIDVLWHPHETSKVATAGWDGLVRFWD